MQLDMMAIAKVGEHLVAADLWAAGHRAFIVSEGVPYDILVEIEQQTYRMQVKTTLGPRNVNSQGKTPNHVYSFDTRRRGFRARKYLLDEDCDLIACVALDTKQIAYLPVRELPFSVALYPTGHVFHGEYKRSRRVTIEELTLEKAIAACR